MEKKHHKVRISWDGTKWKANPGKLGGHPAEDKKVSRGDTIQWFIGSDPDSDPHSEVTLFFPDESIFGLSHVKLPCGENITLEVRRKGKDVANTSKLEENLYAAYCHQAYCFAEGESNPIIIIER